MCTSWEDLYKKITWSLKTDTDKPLLDKIVIILSYGSNLVNKSNANLQLIMIGALFSLVPIMVL